MSRVKLLYDGRMKNHHGHGAPIHYQFINGSIYNHNPINVSLPSYFCVICKIYLKQTNIPVISSGADNTNAYLTVNKIYNQIELAPAPLNINT